MEQIVTINIFGRTHTFKAASDVTSAKEVADYLEKEVAKVESQHASDSIISSHVAVLLMAALNIANEYIELKKCSTEFKQRLAERTSGIIQKLENSA